MTEDEVTFAAVRWLEARAENIRDHGPKTDEGVLTSMAGAHAGALFDAASALRALLTRSNIIG